MARNPEYKIQNNNAEGIEWVEKQLNIVGRQADDIKNRLRIVPNWKAPCPNGVQGFWLKHLTGLHESINQHPQICLDMGKVTKWTATGRTTLIMKHQEKGTHPGNY